MNRTSVLGLGLTDYPATRRVMGGGRLLLDDAAVEEILERVFPEAAPEDVEDFMRTVQRFGRDAAPIANRALPGALQGAVQGGMVAGPGGAVAGGLIGATTRAARPSSPGTLPPQSPLAPGIPPPQRPLAPGIPPPQSPLAPGISSPPPAPLAAAPPAGAALVHDLSAPMAATTLISLLLRPETMPALLALAMRKAGRPSVPVGAHQVAPAAFANAIAELASIAATDGGAPSAAGTDYMYDESGWPRGDLANPAERAAILLSDLSVLAAEEALAEESEMNDDDRHYRLIDPVEDNPVDAYERAAYGE